MRFLGKPMTMITFVFVTLMVAVFAIADVAVRCYTYRINYPSGQKRCGVHCEDRTNYPMDCDADIFDDGYDQEYPLEMLGSPAHDNMIGSAIGDYMDALGGADVMVGLEGPDWLEGREGDDEITGGQGDDYLFGGDGDDQYYYEAGDGSDLIIDPSGNNQLNLAVELAPFVMLMEDGPDLVIVVNAPGAEATISILNFYKYSNFTISYGHPVFF